MLTNHSTKNIRQNIKFSPIIIELMQKEKIILFNIFAELIRELIPAGKAPTKLAMEYDMAKSEISDILHAKKDLRFTTFIILAEMLEIDFDELAKQLKSRLPENFRLSDM